VDDEDNEDNEDNEGEKTGWFRPIWIFSILWIFLIRFACQENRSCGICIIIVLFELAFLIVKKHQAVPGCTGAEVSTIYSAAIGNEGSVFEWTIDRMVEGLNWQLLVQECVSEWLRTQGQTEWAFSLATSSRCRLSSDSPQIFSEALLWATSLPRCFYPGPTLLWPASALGDFFHGIFFSLCYCTCIVSDCFTLWAENYPLTFARGSHIF
jgi:hypothetical protein